jgi:hypothetical protein
MSATVIILPTVHVAPLSGGPNCEEQAWAVEACAAALRNSPADTTGMTDLQREEFLTKVDAAAATLRRLARSAP